ncbi:MAG: MTAP family purine nucleoside phosphorylase [Armatimonadota bacterium]
MDLAIISSRLSEARFPRVEERRVATPFGDATVVVTAPGGRETAYIPRYTPSLTLPSHRINYRANLWALRRLGVRQILSQNAIGSTRQELPPGTITVPHDFLDLTRQRSLTMFDTDDAWVRVDMTEPFCPALRAALLDAGRDVNVPLADRAVFACIEGPRFETPAEIRMVAQLGGDLVGTPLVPEAVFARELQMCFASLSPVINYAAGLSLSVVHTGSGSMVDFYYGTDGVHDRVEHVLLAALQRLPHAAACPCPRALEGAVKGPLPAWWSELP